MNHDVYEGLTRALFEESSEVLMLLDSENGQILDANAAAQRMTGFSLRALIATPVADLFRLSNGQWAITFPMPARTVHLPHAEWGGLLRTFQAIRVPVDVTFTRLNIKPQPLALLRVREALVPESGHTLSGSAVAGSGSVRLRHLVAAVPDCLWSAELPIRGECQFQYLSPVVEQVAGRPADTIGKPLRNWRDLIHPDDRPGWDVALERRRCGIGTHDEYRLMWPDGSIRWVRDDARATRAAGRSVRLYGVFADVTNWRQAEASLRRLADLVNSAEDAIISQSTDGLIVDWNRGAERLYGYTKDEVRAEPVLRLFDPDGVKDYTEIVRRVRCGEPTGPYKMTQVRKGGERFVVSLRVAPIGVGEGGGVSIIARDITK